VSNGRAGERDRRRNGRARQDVVSDWKTERVPHKPIANQNQGRRAELIGSNICTACGIRVRSTTPVLSICRRLIEAGYDADQALHVHRGDVLALTVASIAQGASLEINAKGTGFIRLRAVRTASPVRQIGGGGA
jgi:hypothetical protein